MKPVCQGMLDQLLAQRPAVLIDKNAFGLRYVDNVVRRSGITSKQGKYLPMELWLMIMEQAKDDYYLRKFTLARPRCVEKDSRGVSVLVCDEIQKRETMPKYIELRNGSYEQYQQCLDRLPSTENGDDNVVSPFDESGPENEKTVIKIPLMALGTSTNVIFTRIVVIHMLFFRVHGDYFKDIEAFRDLVFPGIIGYP